MVVLAAACATITYQLARYFLFEWKGPLSGDTPLYLAVGRGILNGLLPYRDLFENKPPGIFLLSALSLWLFNDATLGYIVDAFIVLLLPVLAVIGCWTQVRSSPAFHRRLCLPLAFLFGAIMALYTSWRSGGFQVESYGAFFAVIYLVLIANPRAEPGRLRVALAGIAMLFAVGMKEPFLLTVTAAALLLADSPKRLWRTYVLPLTIAYITGTALLVLSGLVAPFASYLRFQTTIRVSSPWMRGLDWATVFDDVQGYHPLLGILLFVLLGILLLRLLDPRHPFRIAWRILCLIAAGYLLFLAVGMAGSYYNHHFAFAIPGYVALFLAAVREVESGLSHWQRGSLTIALGMVSVIAFTMPYLDFNGLEDTRAWISGMEDAAAKIDGILDNCRLPTYLYVGGGFDEVYGYTKHSPLGPAFFQSWMWLDPRMPSFRETFLENLRSARLIVFTDYRLNDLESVTDDYIHSHFTTRPWKCANAVESPSSPYTFFFRSKGGTSRDLTAAIGRERINQAPQTGHAVASD